MSESDSKETNIVKIFDTKGIGDIAKAGVDVTTKLIDVLRSVAVFVLEPHQIRRIAEARAAEAIIAAEARASVADIEQRAAETRKVDAIRAQANLECVASIAVEESRRRLLPSAHASRTSPTDSQRAPAPTVDQDWISEWQRNASKFSTEEMQTLWARVLVSEVAKPGTFSLRALNAISLLSRADANLFTKMVSHCLTNTGGQRIFVNARHMYDFYEKNQIDRLARIRLVEIGLVSTAEPHLQLQVPPIGAGFQYFDEMVGFQLAPGGEFRPPAFMPLEILTTVGEELAPVCGALPVAGFLDAIVVETSHEGMKIDRTKLPLQSAT